MDLGVGGRTVLVTGASKGIGLATAQAFAAEGADVVIVARDEDRLTEVAGATAAATGRSVVPLAAELSRDAERERLFAAHGDIDILVNNAGAIPAGDLANVSMEAWRTAWELKVFGYVHLCKLYAPMMRARGAGTIVNIIGMGGRAVRPGYICGAAGNAALIGFTNALGAETPADNVRVFGINPAPTLTDRISTVPDARPHPLRRRGALGGAAGPGASALRPAEAGRRGRRARRDAVRAAGALPLRHGDRHGRRRPVGGLIRRAGHPAPA